MNKKDLTAALAQRMDISKKDAEGTVNAVLSLITEALSAGEKVQLVGFGSFETKTRRVRKGSTIGEAPTGEMQEVNTLQFRPGKALKESISGKESGK